MKEDLKAVLLVEPDDATRELYRRMLERHYRVFTGVDARRAIKALQSQNIQAIVAEPFLGNGDGEEFLTQLKEQSTDRHIPLIICSAIDHPRQFHAPATFYLVKPVLPSTLLATLEQALLPTTPRSIE